MNAQTSLPIVVVGAGVIGLSTALHLRDAFPDAAIVVVEAGEVGDGTTPAGAGFVAPWATVLPHLGPAGLALAEYSLAYYRRLAAEAGPDVQFRDNGNLVLFNQQDSMDQALAAIAQNPLYPGGNRVVDAREVGEMTSDAVDASRVAGAIFMPGGIQFETGPTLAHLAARARAADVEIKEQHEVVALQHADGRLQGVELRSADGASTEIPSDTVVLAVGAWLNELLAPVGWSLPLLPFVATRFVTEDLGIAPTMPTIQAKDFPLWIRESTGGFTWGSTPGCAPAHRLGADWTDHRPEQRYRADLVAAMTADVGRVAEVFPALAGAETTTIIQGMPVYTVDRQFFAGAVPGCAGLWAVGGDNESGVSHGPGLGRLVADLVTGAAQPICDAAGYRLDRFEPTAYPTAEDVGQEVVRAGGSFIAEAMARPLGVG